MMIFVYYMIVVWGGCPYSVIDCLGKTRPRNVSSWTLNSTHSFTCVAITLQKNLIVLFVIFVITTASMKYL